MRQPFQDSKLATVLICLTIFLPSSFLPSSRAAAEDAKSKDARPKSISVCFLGNSYTRYNNLPGLVKAMAATQGIKMEIAASTPNGFQLSQHLKEKKSLDTLKSRKWDYVVMQEQSQKPAVFPKEFGKSVWQLAQIASAQGTKTVLYMTWEREKKPDMAPKLSYAYIAAGDATSAKVAPVGIAWNYLRKTRPKLSLYKGDGSHPNRNGTYLAAATICARICDIDPMKFPNTVPMGNKPYSIPAEAATPIKKAAAEAVLLEKKRTSGRRPTPSGS